MTKELTIIDKAKSLIINNEKAFKAVLPKNFDVEKFIATFCLEVQKNEKLAQCSNLIEVGRDVANFGLVIGGMANQAYLLPYWNNKKNCYSAQLIIGYRGYITKLEEAGYSVETELVTNNEIDTGCFQEIRGSKTEIIHRPIRKGIRDRESIALAYCIIKGQNGSQVLSVLSKEEIEEIAKTEKRTGSKEKGNLKKEKGLSDVWLNDDRITDYGQQCIKTVIRNCVKKVNLRIANEMSAYEGQRDAEIMKDINISKTANAHIPPIALQQSFKQEINVEEQPIIEEDKADNIFNHIKTIINSSSNLNGLKASFKYLEVQDGLKWLEANRPDYFAEIESLKKKKMEDHNM